MIEPDRHPAAADTAEFLIEAFGPRAPQALNALKMVLGHTEFMRVLEAYCYAHETTAAGADVNTMLVREGMRQVVLMIHSSRSIAESEVATPTLTT